MNRLPEQRSMRGAEVVLFCVLAGVLATFSRVYVIGGPSQEDQMDQLPLLFRALDPGYLSHDFYVNAVAEQAGPRYYYIHALAAMARWIPVPALLLGATIVAQAMLAWVTFYVARQLHARNDLAAVLAVALVLNVNSFDLGRADILGSSELKPSFAVLGIGLLSLWMGLNGRLLLCILLGAAAIPIHPLVGVEMPAIGLAARALEAVWPGGGRENTSLSKRIVTLAGVAASLGMLLAVGYVCFGAPAATTLSTARFIEILGRCRAPHHYLPSTFGREAFACAAAFLLAMGLTWRVWKETVPSGDPLPRRVLAAVAVVIGLLVCGYVFVEVIPLRAVVTAQVYRMVSVVKWLGFLLIAGVAAQWITRRRSFAGAAPGWCLLMGIGPLQPLAVLLGHALEMARRAVSRGPGRAVLPLLSGLALVAIVSLGTDGLWVEAQGLVLVAGTGLWYLFASPGWKNRWAPAALILLVSWLLVWDRTPRFEIPGVLVRPMVRLDDPGNPCFEIARFARTHTPADSIFILPPDLGNFQLLARRAAVVQWKCIPFRDAEMEDWWTRMHDCYCDPAWKQVPVKEVLVQRYHGISREQLLQVAKKYGATHAVLHKETPCDLPLLFADSAYKIVRLDQGTGARSAEKKP